MYDKYYSLLKIKKKNRFFSLFLRNLFICYANSIYSTSQIKNLFHSSANLHPLIYLYPMKQNKTKVSSYSRNIWIVDLYHIVYQVIFLILLHSSRLENLVLHLDLHCLFEKNQTQFFFFTYSSRMY